MRYLLLLLPLILLNCAKPGGGSGSNNFTCTTPYVPTDPEDLCPGPPGTWDRYVKVENNGGGSDYEVSCGMSPETVPNDQTQMDTILSSEGLSSHQDFLQNSECVSGSGFNETQQVRYFWVYRF